MPKVGKKEFPYTKKGVVAAKKAAKKQGVKMVTGSKHEKTEGKKERIKEYGRKS